MCLRYYEQTYGTGVVPATVGRAGTIQGLNGQDGNQIPGTKYIVPKRVPPSVTLYSDLGTAATLSTTSSPNAPNAGTWAAQGGNENGFGCIVGSGGLTSASAYYFHYLASAEL
jgi:hypothetical protein